MTPLELAILSQRAYDVTPTFSENGVEVVVTETDKELVFAFQGTGRNGSDIARDLRGAPWRDPNLGWCHAGFLKGVRAVWPEIEARISWDSEGQTLIFTGHSKGAAEATIAAALAWQNPYNHGMELVTFGSPRVGFSQLSEVLKTVRVKRYVRGKDAVTTHPWPLWGYRHVGNAIAIGTPRNRWKDHQIQGYVDDLAA